MAAYADFAYYTGVYLGAAIAQVDFPRLARQASAFLDALSHGRLAAIVTAATDTATIDKIKMATCAVAEEYQEIEQGGGEVQSERVGSHAVTYNVAAGKPRAKLLDAARLYLARTGLLYQGVDEIE
jgi:hypothetical protein